MAHKRHLLLVAALDAERKRSLSVMAGAADLELVTFPSLPSALSWVETNDPHVVVFDTGMPKSEKLCERVRSRRTLASVPLVGLAPELSDALISKLFAMGADDVIPTHSSAALMTRLRLVPERQTLMPPPDRGLAVIADSERTRCDVFGRVLLNAGYDVKHAYDESALRFYSSKSDIRVIVANAEIGAARALIEEGRKQGSKAVWIVTAQRRDLPAQIEALDGVPGSCVLGVFSAPENLLFASNELLGGSDHSRESPRMLYATVVTFRPAGEGADEFGFCYNVSRGGLYVRTLAPPEDDSVWIEMRPPRTKKCVRLEGRVAWRRAFGPTALATAPPGFGVEVVDWLGESLALWQEGYSSLAEVPGDSSPNLRAAAAVREANAKRQAPPPPPPRNAADFAPPAARRPSPFSAAAVLIAEIEEADSAEAAPPAKAPAPPPRAGEPPPAAAETKPERTPEPAAEAAPAASVDEDTQPELKDGDRAEPILRADAPSDSERLATVTSPPRDTRRRSARVTGIALLGALLAGAIAVLSWATLRGSGQSAERQESARSMPPETTAQPATVAAPPPITPVAATAAAPVAQAPNPAPDTADAAPEIDLSGGDGTDLPHNQGYLVVRSSIEADVYATGFKVGKTNAKNRCPCQLRWVRLGTGDPPRWISPGRTTMVKCQALTQMSLEPGEPEPEARKRER
jgi:hypothetical protein